MAAPQPAAMPDLRDHLALLWRRKWWIIACVVLAVGAALAYSLTRTELYRASTQVAISGTPTVTGVVTPPQSVAREVNQAQSAAVRAATRAVVGSEPQLSVSGDNATASLTFTAVSADPDAAATAADAYAASFMAERMAQQTAEFEASSSVLQTQLNDADAQLAALSQAEAEALFNEQDALARIAIQADYRDQRQPIEDARARYRTLLDNLTLTSGLAQSGGVQVLDPAQVPSAPFSPNLVRNVALAVILGLIAGVGLAYLMQYLDTRLRTEQELEAVTGLPTLTVVPLYGDGTSRRQKRRRSKRAGSDDGVVVLVQPQSEVAESYRRLRTAVQFLGIDNPLKVLQVTSPTQGDGKTTTAANLAVTAARAGQRVILVDCDLRRPRIHQCFGLENTTGITSILTGQSAVANALVKVQGVSNLVVLPTGPVPPDPAEMLGSAKMGELITLLSASADLVLVDTPPVLAVSDPLIMAARADSLLLVASAGRTDRRELTRAVSQLRQVDAPLIGTVLNRFNPRRLPGYTYGYGYGYGSSHYQADSVAAAGTSPKINGNSLGAEATSQRTEASAAPSVSAPTRRSRLMRR